MLGPQQAHAQCPVGNDLFHFPDTQPPTSALAPPTGLAEGPMAPATIKPDVSKRPYFGLKKERGSFIVERP
jgi:hypothetical protein